MVLAAYRVAQPPVSRLAHTRLRRGCEWLCRRRDSNPHPSALKAARSAVGVRRHYKSREAELFGRPVRQTHVMRLLAALAVVVSTLGLGGTAQASCLAMPLSEQFARADVVLTGVVIAHENGDPRRLDVAVEAVHKGTAPSRITVAAGPDVEMGPPGTQVVTSIDYFAEVGSRHTLYLRWDPPSYRTDACTGSHDGSPTAEERVLFAAAATPVPSPTVGGTQGAPPARLPATSTAPGLTWLGFAIAGALGAALATRRVLAR